MVIEDLRGTEQDPYYDQNLPQCQNKLGCASFRYFAITMCIDKAINTHHMRTNILIDDDLMTAAMQATGVKSKKETVELGLQTLVRLHRQQSIRDFKGKLQWDGDLDEMRTDQ